ncbi:MAG: hydantoinase B/oxoprolinase family protein [Gammaproteobacteria bacterium]|jgi:N-methylhydantoinase B|nr:hydantoinase B/oxoprolinase family protein [Gammaproteobacteria bacterium]
MNRMIDVTTTDPITLEVVRNKVDGIANEMQSTLLRSSFSTVVKEGLDASASLFTPNGETLAQAIAIPIHLATLIPIVETIARTFPMDEMKPGDLYIMNDPYLGGTHLPDIAIVMPVFFDERPIAFSAAMTHHQDVGGMSPGSVPPNATEIYQEGIRIPPLKLREGNEFNHTLVEMLKLNVRVPQVFMGDIGAQISACTVGARRVAELAGRYGYGQTLRIFNELLDRSEQLTRKALEAIPDGTYSYVDYLDNDGVNLDESVRIEVAVTVSGSELHCDFEGTDPQTRGPFNAVKSGSQAAAYYAVRAVTDSSIPTNGGCFRPVSLHLPEGTLVNPVEPAPVNSRTATLKRIAGSIVGALKGALPEQIPADSAGELLVLSLGGKNLSGKPYVVGEFNAGGSGGGPRKDGVDVIETDGSNCMNMPVEALELEAPARVHRMSLRTDSGGVGEFRGGLGCVREIEFLTDNIALTHRGERHRHAARGSQGGGDGAKAFSKIVRRDGTEEVVNSKLFTMVHSGERLIVETAGGGGYGDPNGRDREAVQDDLRNRKVSERSAMNDYGLSN